MSRSKRTVFFTAFAVLAMSALTACGNNPDTAPVVVSAIAITAPNGAIPVTETMQFVATVTDANGNTLTTTPTWTVVNGGGTITSAGLFTAGDSVGTFANSVVATIGTVSSTSSVTVSAGGLANITIVPTADTLAVDATKQFTAAGTDTFGHSVDIPAGLVWTVSSPTAGSVDSTGHFSAGWVAGSYTVTATSGAIVAHATVLVVAGALDSIVVSPNTTTLDPGATQLFTAVGRDVHNNVVAITPTWSAALGGSMDISGTFTAGLVAGTFANTVTATSGLIMGTASVTVNTGPLASIAVTPLITSVFAGQTVQYTAVGHDAGMNVVSFTPVWSANPTAGTISVTGLFTASGTAGTYSNGITATSGSISGSATVAVIPVIVLPPICLPYCGNPCFPLCLP